MLEYKFKHKADHFVKAVLKTRTTFLLFKHFG